jgi:Tfp pilus assembly protein PilF
MQASKTPRSSNSSGMFQIKKALALGALLFAHHVRSAEPPPPYLAPYLPRHDGDVLQDVPPRNDPVVAGMMTLRQALNAAPANLGAALQLASAYMEYGRLVGDARFSGYAEAVLAPWMCQPAPAAAVMVLQATILQYRHQFPAARELLQRSLEVDPHNGQAWLTLATLDMVQGSYPGAQKDCAKVTGYAGLALGLACSANVRMYIGQAAQSLQILDGALRSAPNASAATQAWMAGLMAEAAERLGDWPRAEAHYRRALLFEPQDNFLLVAFADFLLDRGRAREVPPLLEDHAQSDTAFLRIALAHSAMHSPDAARYVWLMAARFEALRFRGADFFGREQARFALELQHDAHKALDMAQQNWQQQRAPWDARVLLEAALAAQAPQASAQVLAFLKQTGLQDPIIDTLARQLRGQLVAGADP